MCAWMHACMHACMHVGKHAMHACIVWWVISRSGAALHLIFAAFLQQVIGWSSVEGTGFQKALAEKRLEDQLRHGVWSLYMCGVLKIHGDIGFLHMMHAWSRCMCSLVGGWCGVVLGWWVVSVHGCIHACMHACMYASKQACMHACMHGVVGDLEIWPRPRGLPPP